MQETAMFAIYAYDYSYSYPRCHYASGQLVFSAEHGL